MEEVTQGQGGEVSEKEVIAPHTQKWQRIVFAALAVVVAVAAAAFAYESHKRAEVRSWALPDSSVEQFETSTDTPVSTEDAPVTATEDVVPVTDELVKEIDYTQYYKNIPKQEGITWFPKPVSVGDKKLITPIQPQGAYQGAGTKQEYFQIGTYFDKEILFTLAPCDGMCTGDGLIFIGSQNGGYELVVKHSVYRSDCGEWCAITLNVGVALNDTLIFKAFDVPEILTVGAQTFIPGAMYSGASSAEPEALFEDSSLNNATKYELVSDTAYGPLFRSYSTITEGQTASLRYSIRLPGGLQKTIVTPREDFRNDDGTLDIVWNDGVSNAERFTSKPSGGCGSGGPEVATTPISMDDLKVVAHSRSGVPIYNLINPNHPLVTEVFEITGGRYYTYTEGTSVEHTITPAEFVDSYGLLVYTDVAGFQVILTNAKYGPQAECGKPVIYLYPTSTTTISVQVGADITKSEPEYNNGWTAVASPEGKLVVGGKEYDSLFWDGYGHGVYPNVEEGFVAKTSEAMDLMVTHLRTMGFNEKESADFRAFWESHLPKTPYTRFHWIFTEEMNDLAKLYISPRPDTLMRAFVDFEGLSEPIEVKHQVIPTYTRTGYVATEWGGLLRK